MRLQTFRSAAYCTGQLFIMVFSCSLASLVVTSHRRNSCGTWAKATRYLLFYFYARSFRSGAVSHFKTKPHQSIAVKNISRNRNHPHCFSVFQRKVFLNCNSRFVLPSPVRLIPWFQIEFKQTAPNLFIRSGTSLLEQQDHPINYCWMFPDQDLNLEVTEPLWWLPIFYGLACRSVKELPRKQKLKALQALKP